jgi:proline iminopeptidase
MKSRRQALRLLSLASAGSVMAPVSEGHAQDPRGDQAQISRSSVQTTLRAARSVALPSGVEELKQVDIGGIKQWISVRGHDRANPMLLVVHGGPGDPEMPYSWYYQTPLEEYFTVVQWDQRGCGKTAATNDAKVVNPTISIERLAADGEEVVAYLRQAYGQEKIFVLGHSWGSVIGLTVAHKHPEWLHAYIGMGQVIYMRENERLSYDFVLEQARKRNNTVALEKLIALAPYAGPNNFPRFDQLIIQRNWLRVFGGMSWTRKHILYLQGLSKLSPDYTDEDLRATSADAGIIWPMLAGVDFRAIRQLACPTFIFAGRHDYATPSVLADLWLKALVAPSKQLFWFENSGHYIQLDEPGAFFMHLVRDVRPKASERLLHGRKARQSPRDPSVGP